MANLGLSLAQPPHVNGWLKTLELTAAPTLEGALSTRRGLPEGKLVLPIPCRGRLCPSFRKGRSIQCEYYPRCGAL